MIRAAGIICKPIRDMVSAVVPPLIEWLRARKIEVFIDKETQECIDPAQPAFAREALGERIDLLIVLGGDGTLLSAARALGGHKVPILAVNLGGLGFLTSVTLDELYPLLDQVLAGKHRTSERMMLDAEIFHDGQSIMRQCALNDAVANKGALARMLDASRAGRPGTTSRTRPSGSATGPAPPNAMTGTCHDDIRSWSTREAGRPPRRMMTSGATALANSSSRSNGSKYGTVSWEVASPTTTHCKALHSSTTDASTPRPTTASTR